MGKLYYEYEKFVKSKRMRDTPNASPRATLTVLLNQYDSIVKLHGEWRTRFLEAGLAGTSAELTKFMNFQIFRFRWDNYRVPKGTETPEQRKQRSRVQTLAQLLSPNSFKKYNEVKDYIGFYISKHYKEKYAVKSIERVEKDIKRIAKGKDDDLIQADEIDKKRFLLRAGEGDIMLMFCSSNFMFYKKQSKICKQCNYRKVCQQRKKNLE